MKANHDTLTGYQAWLRAAEALGVRERDFTALCEAQIEESRREIGQTMTVAQMLEGCNDDQVMTIIGYTFLYDNEKEEIEVTGLRVEDSEGDEHEFDFPFPATVPVAKTTKRRSAKAKS